MRTCGECRGFGDCEDAWKDWMHTPFDPERPAPEDCFVPVQEPTENTEGGRT